MIYDENKHELGYKFDYHIDEKQAIRKQLENQSYISVDDIRRIALWKYDRIICVDEELLVMMAEVLNKEEISVSSEEIQHIVDELISCTGIGMPLASTILKFIRPDVFPIIDVRAYRALYGKKLHQYQYTYRTYVQYCQRIYEVRDKTGMFLDEVDEQLYKFDKEYNGKI